MSDSKVVSPDFQKLEEYCAEVTQERDELKKQVLMLKGKIKHLEDLMASSLPVLREKPEELTHELIIAEMELKRLMDKAMLGSLSLEEMKKYDILVKNKRLSQDKSTQNTGVRQVHEVPLDTIELMKLAGGHVAEEDEQTDN